MIRYLITLFFCMFISCVVTHECFSDQNVNELCDRISEIKVLPFKGEHVNDEVYNKILEMGNIIIPCLIDKISNTDKMPDPRKAPPYNGVTVGDVAFFVFLHVTGQKIEYFLPEDIKAKYKELGVYAYFEFVEDPNNRKLIQENLHQWLLNSKKER